MRGQTTQGGYAASEWSWFGGPVKAWSKDGTLRGVLHCHGHSTASSAVGLECRAQANSDLEALTDRMASVYPTLSFDCGGGQHWGFTTAVSRMGDAATYLQGTWGAKSGTVLLHGDSMGALAALNWAKGHTSSVAAVALTRPTIDLNDMVVNNRGGFAAEINTVYGTYNNTTQGPTYNPCNYGAALNGIPIQIWYASDDAIAVPSTVTTFLGLCASASATSVGAVGHAGVINAVSKDDLMSFFAAHA